MNVENVYSQSVVRAGESCTLSRAACLMRDKHVGALLITADWPHDATILGIITDRDIVVRAVAQEANNAEATVGEFMTRVLVTVPKTASLHDALRAMRSSGVRRLGVTGARGEIVGVVSLDDIVEPLAAELSAFAAVVRSEQLREIIGHAEAEAPSSETRRAQLTAAPNTTPAR